jgi:polysaccharide export outer membrane protein
VFLCLTLILASIAAAQDICLRPGDVINVTVLGEQTLSGRLTVAEDGSIALPLVGDVKVEGQTANAVTRLLVERLKEYVKEPQISVEIVQRAPLKVIFTGAVKSPGLYAVPCDARLAEGLAACGGLAPEADLRRVTLTRSGATPQVVDFRRFLNDGDATQNPALTSGDHIVVAQRPLEPENACRILGNVARPGAYEITGPLTPWDLVAKAGGLLPGSNPKEALLKSKDGEPQKLDMSALMEPQALMTAPVLKPGDTLVIPTLSTQVYMLGGLKAPGPYYLPTSARVMDAIAVAGGVTDAAQLDQAYLLRRPQGGVGQAVRQPVNLRKLLTDGDFTQNVELRAGDTLFVPVRTPRGPSVLDRAAPFLGPLLYLLF